LRREGTRAEAAVRVVRAVKKKAVRGARKRASAQRRSRKQPRVSIKSHYNSAHQTSPGLSGNGTLNKPEGSNSVVKPSGRTDNATPPDKMPRELRDAGNSTPDVPHRHHRPENAVRTFHDTL